ncbi:MAG: ABC transporter permease [Roseibacillus sp.]
MKPLKKLLRENAKVLVIFGLLVGLFVVTSILQPAFRDAANLTNTMRWIGLYGIISIGVAFIIITGGIDLSIGSLIALSGVMLPMLLKGKTVVTLFGIEFFKNPLPVWGAFGIVLAVSLLIGLFHGILVTKLGLQPFLVTLCGLFIYRGLARGVGNDQTQGFGGEFGWLKDAFVKARLADVTFLSVVAFIAIGLLVAVFLYYSVLSRLASEPTNSGTSGSVGVKKLPRLVVWLIAGMGGLLVVLLARAKILGFFSLVPMSFVVLIILGITAAIVLNKTVFGRYLLAIGHNEEAAKFSGIKTDRVKIAAYMICSLLGGFAGMLFVLDTNGATPSSFGNFYELYAIAGAVLGGCSLRGGEGAIFGVICGAALVQVAEKAVFFLGVEEKSKFTVIGIFILVGVIADELFRRWTEKQMGGAGGGSSGEKEIEIPRPS